MVLRGTGRLFDLQDLTDRPREAEPIAKVQCTTDFDADRTLDHGFRGGLHPSTAVFRFDESHCTVKAIGRGGKRLGERLKSHAPLVLELEGRDLGIDIELVRFDNFSGSYHFTLSTYYRLDIDPGDSS